MYRWIGVRALLAAVVLYLMSFIDFQLSHFELSLIFGGGALAVGYVIGRIHSEYIAFQRYASRFEPGTDKWTIMQKRFEESLEPIVLDKDKGKE